MKFKFNGANSCSTFAFLLLVVAVPKSWSKTVALLERSSRIKITVNYLGHHCWTSDHEIVYRENENTYEYRISLFDTKTNKVHGVYISSHGSPSPLDKFYRSPDGRRLLLPLYADKGKQWVTISLDGKGKRNWPLSNYTSMAAWLDNSRWVEFTSQIEKGRVVLKSFSIHDLNETMPTKHHSIPSPGIQGELEILGITPQSQAVFINWRERDARAGWIVDVFTLGINQAEVAIEKHSIRMPKNSGVGTVELSPDGKSMAWQLYFSTSDEEDTNQGRRDPNERMSLQISRLNGGGLREIGFIRTTSRSLAHSHEGGEHIAWLPDGKRLSYWHANELWTVPVQN